MKTKSTNGEYYYYSRDFRKYIIKLLKNNMAKDISHFTTLIHQIKTALKFSDDLIDGIQSEAEKCPAMLYCWIYTWIKQFITPEFTEPTVHYLKDTDGRITTVEIIWRNEDFGWLFVSYFTSGAKIFYHSKEIQYFEEFSQEEESKLQISVAHVLNILFKKSTVLIYEKRIKYAIWLRCSLLVFGFSCSFIDSISLQHGHFSAENIIISRIVALYSDSSLDLICSEIGTSYLLQMVNAASSLFSHFNPAHVIIHMPLNWINRCHLQLTYDKKFIKHFDKEGQKLIPYYDASNDLYSQRNYSSWSSTCLISSNQLNITEFEEENLWFHGTSLIHIKSILGSIDPLANVFPHDFGNENAFYLGNNLYYTVNWGWNKFGCNAAVLVFNIDQSNFKNLGNFENGVLV